MNPEKTPQPNKHTKTILRALYIAVLGYALGTILAWLFSFAQLLLTFSYTEMLGMVVATTIAYLAEEAIRNSTLSQQNKLIVASALLLVTIALSTALSLYLRNEALQYLNHTLPH